MDKKKIQIIGISVTMLVIIVGVVIWGVFQQLRFDTMALNQPGYTLNDSYETVQFSNDATLYRTWDKKEIIEDDFENKEEIASHTLLYFNNGNLAVAKEVTLIDTQGIANVLPQRTILTKNGKQYNSEKGNVESNHLMKIDNRNYFLNADAEIMINDESVGTVSNPQIFIDKTGSVTLYSEQKKQRYIGYLKLKISDSIILDVSDEVYYVGDREIDLSKFGGTDNQKYVVDFEPEEDSSIEDSSEEDSSLGNSTGDSDSATVENSQNESDRNYDTASYNQNDGSTNQTNSKNGTSDSKSNNSSGKNTINPDIPISEQLPNLDDYDLIMQLLGKLNSQGSRQIPTVRLTGARPGAVNADISIEITDDSSTLTGSIEVQVWDAKTDKIVSTAYITPGKSAIKVSGLTPNSQYFLGYKYQYDLSDLSGIKTLSMKDTGRTFDTLPVSAIYTITRIRANSIDLNVRLDAQVGSIKEAKVKVINARNDAQVDEVKINGESLNQSGATIQVTGLTANTAYRFELSLTYENGSLLSFNQSNIFITSINPILYDYSVSINENNQILMDVQWMPGEHTPISYEVTLVGSDGKSYETSLLSQADGKTSIIPTKLPVKKERYGVELTIMAKDENGAEKAFSYTLEKSLKYQPNGQLEILEKTDNYLLKFQIDQVEGKDISATLEAKNKSSEKWYEVVDGVRLNQESDTLILEKELSKIEAKKFEYRVVVTKGNGDIVAYIY